MHLYLSARDEGPPNAVHALNSESAIALLETGCVTCVSFGADWPQGAGRNRLEAMALAEFLKTAVSEARLPWVDWNLYCPDLALHRQLSGVLHEMDDICRKRGQEVRQYPAQGIAVGLNPDFCFECFVVGDGNEMAYAQAVLAGIGAPMRNVPLWMYGDCGLGKTHLLHSVGWQYLAVNPGRQVALLHGSEFIEPDKCLAKLSAADALIIDDIQCAWAIPVAVKCRALLMDFLTKNCLLAVSAEDVSDRLCETVTPPDWSGKLLASSIEVELKLAGPHLGNSLLDVFLARTGYALATDLRDLVLANAKGNPRFLQAIVKKIVAYEQFEGRELSPTLLASWLRESGMSVVSAPSEKN